MAAAALTWFRHRALAEILVGRELKARYRGTMLGFLWSFAGPLMMMGIYVLVFAVYLRIDQPNYAVFLLCGLLPWTAFVSGLLEGMNSIINNGSIIKKVYLPLEIFPFVSVATNAAHFVLSMPVLVAVIAASGLPLSPHLALFPLLLALQFAFTFALALTLASLAVQFRDLLHVVPNLVMVWFYLTPILYPIHLVPQAYSAAVLANPMTWLIGAYQDIFFHQRAPSLMWLGAFAATSAGLLALGTWLFRRRVALYPEMV